MKLTFEKNRILTEGEYCVTHEGRIGECKLAHDCVWVREQLSARQMTFRDIIRCSWRGKVPIICCSIKTLVDGDEMNAATPETPVMPQM